MIDRVHNDDGSAVPDERHARYLGEHFPFFELHAAACAHLPIDARIAAAMKIGLPSLLPGCE
jgi:hypothetical protein